MSCNRQLPEYVDVIEELLEENHVLIHITERTDIDFVRAREERYRAKGMAVTIYFEQSKKGA